MSKYGIKYRIAKLDLTNRKVLLAISSKVKQVYTGVSETEFSSAINGTRTDAKADLILELTDEYLRGLENG